MNRKLTTLTVAHLSVGEGITRSAGIEKYAFITKGAKERGETSR